MPLILICYTLSSCATISAKDIGLMLGGVAASVATHELGHYIAMGGDMDFSGLSWTTDHEINDFQRNAGLLAQAIASEAILWTKSEGPFWLGFLATNTFEELAYPTIRHDQGDFEDMDNKTAWSALWLTHGASVAARMVHRKAWNWIISPGMVGYRREF